MNTSFNKLSVIAAKRLELFSCGVDTPLGEVAKTMVAEDISSLAVVDDNGGLAGIISRRDFMPLVLLSPAWRSWPVSRCMSKQVVTVTCESSLVDVAALLLERRVHRVVVVDGEPGQLRPVGVVSDSDLLYHLVKRGGEL